MDRLETALRAVLGQDEPVRVLARILTEACPEGSISCSAIQGIEDEDWRDVLLLGNSWRLLIPWNRTSKTLDWDDGAFLFQPDEVYRVPRVVRHLVARAEETGEWDAAHAVSAVFKEIGDPDYERMPRLVQLIGRQARWRKVNAVQVKQACDEAGLGQRVDPLIAELKACGIMSPRLGSLGEALEARCPIYELNPCLFQEGSSVECGS